MPKDSDAVLSAAVQALIEHFDSVRIVATTHELDKSEMHTLGAGNVFAQRGSVQEWLDSTAGGEGAFDSD